MAQSCPSCGAALADDAAVCDLCGTPTAAAPVAAAAEVVCSQCGHAPPAGSQFCNRCGAPVARELPPSPAPAASAERPSSDVGRRALAVIGVGVLAVTLLYGLTLLSNRPAPAADLDVPDTDALGVGEAAPIPEGAPPLPDTLQAAADRFAAQGTAQGWYESARFYLTAAFESIQTDPESSVRWARRAIADFERSLAIEESPRVRVALAEAATFDPSDPMRPVLELQAVLEADPDNLDATFLLGERRLMIGRTEPARESFERVLELAPAGSPLRQRAQEALASIPAE